jgi:hypothetical protein
MSTTGGILQVKQEAQQRQQQQQQQCRLGPFGAIGALADADFMAEAEIRTALLLLLVEQLLLVPHIKRAVINLKLISQLASKGFCCDADEVLNAAAAAMDASQDVMSQAGRQATAAMDESGPRRCATGWCCCLSVGVAAEVVVALSCLVC